MPGVTRSLRQAALLGSLALLAALATVGQTGAGTSDQVAQGLQTYQAHCAGCHGANLEGLQGPALARDDFRKKWQDFNALRRYIHRNMPQGAGGTLSQQEAVNLSHYLLERNGLAPDGFGEPAFRDLWTVADGPVAASQAQRSWLWGPEGFAVAWEKYAEAPGGLRLVQYFDKTRMEITDLDADRSAPGYVTNGLLATELVSGQLQIGDNAFETRQAAAVNVAGDPDDGEGPTYASFGALRGPVAPSTDAVTATIDRAGTVGRNDALGGASAYAQHIAETGHNIPNVFWEFLNSSGPIIQNDQLVDGRIFEPWWRPTGLPITEAYWARVKVGGQVQDVLIQVYERRVLTYTPANPDGFQVEMGNVGRHYYAWRYGT
jgi:hypothetical protein